VKKNSLNIDYQKQSDNNAEHIKYLENVIATMRNELRSCREQNKMLKDENRLLKQQMSKMGVDLRTIKMHKDSSRSDDKKLVFVAPNMDHTPTSSMIPNGSPYYEMSPKSLSKHCECCNCNKQTDNSQNK
jgi:hypothetical protein